MTQARSPNRYSAPTAAGSPVAGARRRVVVAMSGGVDSAVAAALMQQAGHEVIGITLQLYDNAEATRRVGACCAGRDIHDARRAAEHLGIPHYVLDYEQRFRHAVVETFADSYAKGETPIPCVSCNQEIKFKDLLETAQDLGADLLATGHYVERRDEPSGPALYRSADTARDQSYFLFATTPVQLARLAFPLGGMTKPEVRKLASELGLPVATKPDSQDICFVASGSYADVVGRLRPEAATPGEIVHVDGRVLGRHEGIMHFTVGQRRGLKISAAEPLFVIGIEPGQARVIVGPRDCLAIETLWLREMNWLGDKPLAATLPPDGLDVYVRIRSAQLPRPGIVFVDAATGNVGVRLPGGELGVARGQACVIYRDGSHRARVLGGGFIADTERQPSAVAA